MVDALIEVFHFLFDLVAEGGHLSWCLHIDQIGYCVGNRINVNVGVRFELGCISPTIFFREEPPLHILLNSWKESLVDVASLPRTEVATSLDVLSVKPLKASDDGLVNHIFTFR